MFDVKELKLSVFESRAEDIAMLVEAGTPSVTMRGGQMSLGLKGISQACFEGDLCQLFNSLYDSSSSGRLLICIRCVQP